jgi:hypothetical protein
MWLWARCCSLLLQCWWVRGREEADMVWARLRYNLATTGTSLIVVGNREGLEATCPEQHHVAM